jgi:hypothetical protein
MARNYIRHLRERNKAGAAEMADRRAKDLTSSQDDSQERQTRQD